jgi:hypothetical protein
MTATEKLTQSQVPQILTFVFKFGDYLHQLWNYYMAVNALIVGWLLSTKAPWDYRQKAAVLVLYLAFIAINLSALLKMYGWLNKTITDLQRNASRLDEDTPEIKVAIRDAKIPGGRVLPVLVYGFAASAVIVSILWLK